MGKRSKTAKQVYTERPDLEEDQVIARVVGVRGGGIYECLVASGDFLAIMSGLGLEAVSVPATPSSSSSSSSLTAALRNADLNAELSQTSTNSASKPSPSTSISEVGGAGEPNSSSSVEKTMESATLNQLAPMTLESLPTPSAEASVLLPPTLIASLSVTNLSSTTPSSTMHLQNTLVPDSIASSSSSSGDKSTKMILASLSAQYQKTVWVKMGCFVIIEPFENTPSTSNSQKKKKAKAVPCQIQHVLMEGDVRHLKGLGNWPSVFDDVVQSSTTTVATSLDPQTKRNNNTQLQLSSATQEEEEEEDDEMYVDRNRRQFDFESSEDEEDEEE